METEDIRMRITLKERVQSLLFISFRSPELKYDNYTMEISTPKGNKTSNQTRKTIVPKLT